MEHRHKKLPMPEYDHRNGIVIFGEPRSGTTWLAEMLASIEGAIINWEPLHPLRGVVPESFKWGDRPYIPHNVKNTEYYRFMGDILALRLGNDWTRRLAPDRELGEGSTVITKMVRGNMLVPWFLKNLDMARKPILILRHPLDTCISQIRNFGGRYSSVYEVPDCINNERFIKQRAFIQDLGSQLERQVALWCLNTVPTLEHPGIDKKLTVLFYENLVSDPKTEMIRVFKKLGVGDVPNNLGDLIDFRKASSSDFKGHYITDPNLQLEKNLKELDRDILEKVQAIFDHFKFDLYGTGSPYPKKTSKNMENL